MDEFDPDVIQLAYVIDMYTTRLTELYGGYGGWIRQAGHPLNNLFFFSDKEIVGLWNGDWPRVRAIFRWAGLKEPETEVFSNGTFLGLFPSWHVDVFAVHVRAIQEVYAHPEYW